MLVEIWSNHQTPIVHPHLTSQADILDYVAKQIRSISDMGLLDNTEEGEQWFTIRQTNGVSVTFHNAIVRN